MVRLEESDSVPPLNHNCSLQFAIVAIEAASHYGHLQRREQRSADSTINTLEDKRHPINGFG